MIEVGRLCVKIAGREAGKKCVVIDVVDNKYVMIDGQVRRKKCNMIHLEPLDNVLDIKKNASHAEVVSELKKLKIEVRETKKKEKTEKPKKIRRKKKIEAEEQPKKAKKEKKGKEVKKTKEKKAKKEEKTEDKNIDQKLEK